MNTSQDSISIRERLATLVQHLLPHRLLSSTVHYLAGIRYVPWKNFLIRAAIRRFGINLKEAASEHITDYANFNAFFTRQLKPGIRPVDASPSSIVSPADGVISQIGAISDEQLFQAKGQTFSCTDILGGEALVASLFTNGNFATIYLSPKDYHRLHIPLDGHLIYTQHIPGRLFSVAPFTAKTIPAIYARNERLVCIFDTQAGRIAYIMVGAMLVSSMETVWSGLVTPPYGKKIHRIDYSNQNIRLNKGDELGRFNMGSTVILLFEQNKICWDSHLSALSPLNVGQSMGQMLNR